MGPNAGSLSAVAKQAEQLRINGNNYFKKDRFGAAIDAYTEAIALMPDNPVYFTNRALCHLKRNNWERVEEDCRKAIQLNQKSVKAHYMLGLALLQREEYAKGIKELEKGNLLLDNFYPKELQGRWKLYFSVRKKALDLGRGANPKGYMVEEIWQELAKAKYQDWERSSTKRSWELQSLKEACESALKEKHVHDISQEEGFLDELSTNPSKQVAALGRVFSKAAEDDTPTEVPDYLCCRITLDIFRDPVITPSGLTYERAVILDHLDKVGKFDPVTREPLNRSQLVSNLAIKEAVQSFLDKHGWAYKID